MCAAVYIKKKNQAKKYFLTAAPPPSNGEHYSPFTTVVGNLISQLIPLLLGLALGTLSSCKFLE